MNKRQRNLLLFNQAIAAGADVSGFRGGNGGLGAFLKNAIAAQQAQQPQQAAALPALPPAIPTIPASINTVNSSPRISLRRSKREKSGQLGRRASLRRERPVRVNTGGSSAATGGINTGAP